jgi:hypothetical protein
MNIFESCRAINALLTAGKEAEARNQLITLLADIEGAANEEYTPLVNRLIREVGLYPYMDETTSDWQERFVLEAFKEDVGDESPVTLHREQKRLLNELLDGKDIAVSAPTSFGKSFVIDAFIALREPKNVVILVPTIALADETRRRLQKKFGSTYKLITTADNSLASKNIFIFPQERAIAYARAMAAIDILIVDEFYKASKAFDRERAPALIRSILEFGKIAKQRYFLAPNISELADSDITRGMEFIRLDFNTVYLEKHELYNEIGTDESLKSSALLNILNKNDGKTLVYAGTFSNIKTLSTLLTERREPRKSTLNGAFENWLARNYSLNWDLTKLVRRGTGVHNGRLHRSLAQIQVRLFEEQDGLDLLVSTSSIIEGVNTSAKNVVLWSNRNGRAKLTDFTYKNIIGRSGRMFRHFVGRIFILEKPPKDEATQLELQYPDELLGIVEAKGSGIQYTREQLAKIKVYEDRMKELVGIQKLEELQRDGVLLTSNTDLVLKIATSITNEASSWNGLRNLNSDDPDRWDRLLYQLLKLDPANWGIEWSQYVQFVKILSNNWTKTIPELLDDLSGTEIGIEEFFELERNTCFRLGPLLGDVQTIFNAVREWEQIELAPAISKFCHAFLPKPVYQLEEYGLPRMLSRKLHFSGVIDLEQPREVHDAIVQLKNIGLDHVLAQTKTTDDFDKYILKYFFDGIASAHDRSSLSTYL